METKGLHRIGLKFGEGSSEDFKFHCLRLNTGCLLKSKLSGIILS